MARGSLPAARDGARAGAGAGAQGPHADGEEAAGLTLQRACRRAGREKEVRGVLLVLFFSAPPSPVLSSFLRVFHLFCCHLAGAEVRHALQLFVSCPFLWL